MYFFHRLQYHTLPESTCCLIGFTAPLWRCLICWGASSLFREDPVFLTALGRGGRNWVGIVSTALKEVNK